MPLLLWHGKKIMRTFALLAFVSLVGLIAAGCPEMPDTKPAANAPKPPPPPPPPNGQQGAADESAPVEEVDPQQFAQEQAAANELDKMGFLVIREGSEKVVTSINAMGTGRKIDKPITDLLPRLFRATNFDFKDTDFGDEQAKAIPNNRRLASLVLQGTPVGDDGLAQIANLVNLESLILSNTKITDAGLPHLAKLSKLKSVDLSDTKITDRGMPEIAKLQNVNWLLLSGTAVTEESLPLFANMPNLRHLTLCDTKVTEQAIAAFKASHPQLKVDTESRRDAPGK
jgi:hypothetical protein